MNIINLLFKKTVATDDVVKNAVVIFNRFDHESLVSAVFYALLRKQIEDIDINLVDIRDVVPDEADQYVWVGTASTDAFASYRKQIHTESGRDLREQRRMLEHMDAKSLRIRPIGAGSLFDTTLDLVTLTEGRSEVSLCRRFSRLVDDYMKPSAKLEDIEFYGRVLELAHRYYEGYPVKLEDFHCLANADKQARDAWDAQQKVVNRLSVRKMRPVVIGGRALFMVNTTGLEIYGILRRLRCAKKEWIHVSSGAYGTVAYSSVPIALQKENYIGHILTIAPEAMPLDAFGARSVARIAG
jgi:hypothetical protein